MTVRSHNKGTGILALTQLPDSPKAGIVDLKKYINTLFQNDLLLMLLNGVILYVFLNATIMAILQVPPEAILDSGLKEILMIFED